MMLTLPDIKATLDYDPDSGVFTWKTSKGFRVKGNKAGTTCRRGYISIGIGGKIYKAHRLAWFFVHGVWPSGQIDHIDRDKSNNRIANLRDVEQSVNQENRGGPRTDNKLGTLGVSTWHDGRPGFRAQIKVRGKVRYIGTFDTSEEAHAAYIEAKKNMHAGAVL
jgi:hypothetical protein